MQKTTFARITTNGLEEHIVKDHITLTCLNKRFIYKNHKGQYFRIYDNERIYTSSHSRYKSYDYILGKNLDSDILKDLTLVAGTAEEDTITIIVQTGHSDEGGNNIYDHTAVIQNYIIPFNCPKNHRRCTYPNGSDVPGAFGPGIWYRYGKANTPGNNGIGTHVDGLQSLLCYPSNIMPTDPHGDTLCQFAYESTKLNTLYEKYNTDKKLESVSCKKISLECNPTGSFWDTNFGKDLSQIIYSKTLPTYLSTGTMNAWLSNYNGSISDGSSMRERINDNEFTYWPCGFNKDPISGEEVAMCQDGTGKIYGTVCDSKKTEFCVPAWETLLYNPNAPTNSEIFNSGSNNMFGLCYNPNSDASAVALCSTDKANMAPITKMFNPILYAKQEAKYKLQQEAIKKANKKRQEKLFSTILQVGLAVTGFDMYPIGMAISLAAAAWVHDYTTVIIFGSMVGAAKIMSLVPTLEVTENLLVDGNKLEKEIKEGDEGTINPMLDGDIEDTNLINSTDAAAAEVNDAEDANALEAARDNPEITKKINTLYSYANDEEKELIISNALNRLDTKSRLNTVISAGQDSILPRLEEQEEMRAQIQQNSDNMNRRVRANLNEIVGKNPNTNLLIDGQERGLYIGKKVCLPVPGLLTTGECDQLRSMERMMADFDAGEAVQQARQRGLYVEEVSLEEVWKKEVPWHSRRARRRGIVTGMSEEIDKNPDNTFLPSWILNDGTLSKLQKSQLNDNIFNWLADYASGTGKRRLYSFDELRNSEQYFEYINKIYNDMLYAEEKAAKEQHILDWGRGYLEIVDNSTTSDWLDRLYDKNMISKKEKEVLLRVRKKFGPLTEGNLAESDYWISDIGAYISGFFIKMEDGEWVLNDRQMDKLFTISQLDIRIARFSVNTIMDMDMVNLGRDTTILKGTSDIEKLQLLAVEVMDVYSKGGSESLMVWPGKPEYPLLLRDDFLDKFADIDRFNEALNQFTEGGGSELATKLSIQINEQMSTEIARQIRIEKGQARIASYLYALVLVPSLSFLITIGVLESISAISSHMSKVNKHTKKKLNNASGTKSNLDDSLKRYNNSYNKNNTLINNLETGINTNSKPNKVPVQLYNYIFNNYNTSVKQSINFGVEISNNKLQTTIKPGQKINSQISQNTSFSIEGNKMDNEQMAYDTNIYFSEPYIRRVLQTQGIHQILQNTTSAYKKLANLGFDMPFNPFQTPAYPDNAANIGTTLYDGSFIGGTNNVKLSQKWWNNWLPEKTTLADVSKVFDNKYIQFMSMSQTYQPTTTCSSFCALFGAKVNTADTNFNNNLKTLKNICPLNPTDSPGLMCYKCYDNTDEENAASKMPTLKCKDIGSNDCINNPAVVERCPWTCKQQTRCTSQNDTYVVDKKSTPPFIRKVDCYTETGLQQCGKTCGVCHNIINTCNCYYPAPTPNPKSVYIGKSPLTSDYTLSSYFNITWNLLGKTAWWYKETGLSDTSCTCDNNINATVECQKCGIYEVSSCYNVDINNCENHYIYNNPSISNIKGYFRCILDSCNSVCVPNNYRCGDNYLSNLPSTYKQSMKNTCKTIVSGDTEISYKYINFGKTPTSKNALQQYPINCNQFCQMKSLLGYEKNKYTYYGIQSNNSTLCTCSTSPMNCQACILKTTPLSEGGNRISNCDDYCRILYLGEQHRDGYHIFGECGNSAGTSYDNITNCCNCFMYDSKNEQVKILNNIRDDECKHCGKYITKNCESLTSREISMNIKCRDYYEETGGMTGLAWASCRDNTNSKPLCVQGPDCSITLRKPMCGTKLVPQDQYQQRDCKNVKLSGNEECYFYYNVDDPYQAYYKYHCVEDPNDTKKCIEPQKHLSCLDDPNYAYHSSALRGCDPNKSGKALPLVLTPRPAPFPGHLGPTPAPGNWPIEDYKTCPTLSADIISTFMCTNYCNNSKIPDNIKGDDCKKYCPVASCYNKSRHYTDREVCAGPIIQPLRGANYDCSFNYNVLQNSCNAFVVEPSSPYGYKQCFFTLSSECIASDQLCKLPDRVDDTEIPIQPIGSKPIFQTDYLHHFCKSSPDRSLQAIATLDWTSDNFKIQALNRLTKPLYGTNGVLSNGNRGGICDTPTPISVPLPTTTLCAKDFSHVFMWNTPKGTITCNTNGDCKNFDPCYNCYRQSGIYCSSPKNETREKVCRTSYNLSADISYINNVITISCKMYNTHDYSSVPINCLPEPTVSLNSLPTCFGKTWLNTTGDASGLPIYASIDLGISGQDYCNYLEPPANREDGSLCGGYYNWDQEDTGIQCYWNNDSSRCVWAINNNISTVAFCKTPKESICYISKYTEPYTSRSDLSTCIGPYNLILKDCCYAIAFSKLDGSLCGGFIKDTCNNIYKQCIYNSDISKCDISSSKHPNSISCNKAITRKYLGYSEDPSICSNQQPINTTYNSIDSSKCLAFYTLPDKKPRLFDINYLDASMFGDRNPMWYSINKSWYDNSTHTVECVGEPSQHSTSTTLSECASDCHDSSKCSGFWSSATASSKGWCGLCITKVPKCGYNKTLSCESLTLNDNTNCSNYYKFWKASTEGQNNATMCIPNKKDKNKCQSSFIICNDSNDYISDNCNNGPATINIRRKILGKDNMIDKYTYYSKVPEIWVSKDVPYAYAPYDCSEDTPGWPNKTGFVCQEQPVNGSCVAAIETKETSGHFCKPNILPLNLNNRTCLLQPTPAPISPIFNDMSLGWNMIPYRENGSEQSWPRNQCVQASVIDTVAGNYDFDTEASCNAISNSYEISNKCTRTLGERCENPLVTQTSFQCRNGKTSIGQISSKCTDFVRKKGGCNGDTECAATCYEIDNDPITRPGTDWECRYDDPGSRESPKSCYIKPQFADPNQPNKFSDIPTDPYNACGEGLTCYATDTISRANGQLQLCSDNASRCRCLYSSAIGGNVFDVPGNNGTESCNDYCYSGISGGIANSKCLYGYDNTNNKRLSCSSTDSSNITCTCQLQSPWASSFDSNISNRPESFAYGIDVDAPCKRLIGHDCSGAATATEYESLGLCKPKECGQGLTCVDSKSLKEQSYNPCSSSDCVCLPVNKLTMTPEVQMMFPNDPPQQQICEFKSDIPPLHQRCCKDPNMNNSGTTYDLTKQLCCNGVLYDITGLNLQCCGKTVIDTSSEFCCNNISYSYSKNNQKCVECNNIISYNPTYGYYNKQGIVPTDNYCSDLSATPSGRQTPGVTGSLCASLTKAQLLGKSCSDFYQYFIDIMLSESWQYNYYICISNTDSRDSNPCKLGAKQCSRFNFNTTVASVCNNPTPAPSPLGPPSCQTAFNVQLAIAEKEVTINSYESCIPFITKQFQDLSASGCSYTNMLNLCANKFPGLTYI